MKLPTIASLKTLPRSTLLVALVISGMCAETGGGFMVIPVLVVLVFIYSFGLLNAIHNPAVRRPLAMRAAIWLVAFATIFSIHFVRSQLLRSHAEDMLARIDAYAAAHGHCAPGIEDLGISREEMTSRLGYSYYMCEDGRQVFYYAASFTVFSMWRYDFQKRTWHLHYS